ncbi:MAG: DUF373 family protein [Candidatus Verstraetearchaeota archaeon]|jgi:putative membrane protein|nr:DUF373 family protein [Candidatus Verstraetearchaeota archaeon]
MEKNILVLNVDKDNDIGRILGLSTPIIGREKVLSVAISFALKNPEDSDVNSIFEAIKVYDELIKENYKCEVAIITGLPEGGYKSDIKILSELEEVLKNFKADGVIFISDGVTDEQALPIIQSKVPIISVKRVFVQQEKSVEETYVLFYRYLKKLTEPEYSKTFLGIPGLILFTITILYFLNLINYLAISLGTIVSIILIVKGFNIDKIIRDAWKESPIRLITSIIGIIISSIAIYRGINIALMETSLENLQSFVGLALSNIIDLFIIGIAIYFTGRLIVKYLEESQKIWHEIVILVALLFIRQIVIEISTIIINPKASLIPLLFVSGLGVLVCGFLVIIFSIRPIFFRK